jgi:hypothetical protein
MLPVSQPGRRVLSTWNRSSATGLRKQVPQGSRRHLVSGRQCQRLHAEPITTTSSEGRLSTPSTTLPDLPFGGSISHVSSVREAVGVRSMTCWPVAFRPPSRLSSTHSEARARQWTRAQWEKGRGALAAKTCALANRPQIAHSRGTSHDEGSASVRRFQLALHTA